MLYYAVVFLLIAILAGVLGFGVISLATTIAKAARHFPRAVHCGVAAKEEVLVDSNRFGP